MIDKKSKLYSCWLSYSNIKNSKYKEYLENVLVSCKSEIIDSAVSELGRVFKEICDSKRLKQFTKMKKTLKILAILNWRKIKMKV